MNGEGSLADARAAEVVPGLHPRAYLTLGILLLFTIFSYVDRMVIVLLVDPIKTDLGINDVQISLLQGLAFALCYSLASYPLGWLADRYSRRWVIYGGITIWSVATAAGGLAANFGELFAARFFVGIGEAALLPAAFSMLGDLFPPERRAFAAGVLVAGSTIGAAIALVAGGPIVGWAEATGGVTLPFFGLLRPWQVVFVIVGMPGLFAAFLIFLAPETRQGAGKTGTEKAEGMGEWLKRHWLFMAGLTLGSSIISLIAYAVANWTPTYFSRVLGVNMAEVGLSVGLVQIVAGLIGFVGGGLLIDRLQARGIRNVGYRYLIGVALLLFILVPSSFLLIESVGLMLVAVGLINMSMPWLVASVAHLQLAAPPRHRAQVIALLTMVTTLVGMIAGPSSVALLTEYVFKDPQKVGWSIAVVNLIGAPVAIACLLFTYRASERALAAARSDPG